MSILRLKKSMENVSDDELRNAYQELKEMKQKIDEEYTSRAYSIWAPKVALGSQIEYEKKVKSGSGIVVTISDRGVQIVEDGYERRKLVRWNQIRNVIDRSDLKVVSNDEDELNVDMEDETEVEAM